MQLLFYSAFTSHVEVALTLTCDTFVGVRAHTHSHALLRVSPLHSAAPARQLALLYDWLSNLRNDFLLRLNLNRLRSGLYDIASRDEVQREVQREGQREGQREREHAQ